MEMKDNQSIYNGLFVSIKRGPGSRDWADTPYLVKIRYMVHAPERALNGQIGRGYIQGLFMPSFFILARNVFG